MTVSKKGSLIVLVPNTDVHKTRIHLVFAIHNGPIMQCCLHMCYIQSRYMSDILREMHFTIIISTIHTLK